MEDVALVTLPPLHIIHEESCDYRSRKWHPGSPFSCYTGWVKSSSSYELEFGDCKALCNQYCLFTVEWNQWGKSCFHWSTSSICEWASTIHPLNCILSCTEGICHITYISLSQVRTQNREVSADIWSDQISMADLNCKAHCKGSAAGKLEHKEVSVRIWGYSRIGQFNQVSRVQGRGLWDPRVASWHMCSESENVRISAHKQRQGGRFGWHHILW
jgi:hypothetical protein